MDLRRFSLVSGASVTGGSACGCGRQPERYRSALSNNCTQTQISDYTYTVTT